MTKLTKSKSDTPMRNVQHQKLIDIRSTIPMVAIRLNTEIDNSYLNKMAEDIVSEFQDVETKVIITALKKGGTGHYGRTFKLSIQEVCYWIREELKNHPVKLEKKW